MKKPSAAAIRNAEPLTSSEHHGDPTRCNVCGEPPGHGGLRLWRAHDGNDRPIASDGALVFIAKDHTACIQKMEAHPRLFAEEMGLPGHFPRLCGGCTFRSALTCSHPKLKKNGGEGLNVQLSGMFANVIICSRGKGCHTPMKEALSCEGQRLEGETP